MSTNNTYRFIYPLSEGRPVTTTNATTRSVTSNQIRIKTAAPQTVRFINNPWDEIVHPGITDWVAYRQVAAFDGFYGNITPPKGLQTFPVFDATLVPPQMPGEKWEPLFNQTGSDVLLGLVMPSSKYPTDTGRPLVQTRMLINVVDENGYHKLLNVTHNQGVALARNFLDKMKEFKGYESKNKAYKISFTGEGAQIEIAASLVDDTPIDKMPASLNVVDYLNRWRDEVESFYEAASSAEATADEDALVGNDEESVAAFEESVAEPKANYAAFTDNKLKQLLAESNVEVPAKIGRAALIALANKNLG